MKHLVAHARKGIAAVALLAAASTATAQIQLLGTGEIPGNALDNTGLTGLLEDGITPKNQIGGLGSAIAYAGFGDFYFATPDRGPADGATTYPDRVYLLRIGVHRNHTGGYSVVPRVWDTRLLRSETRRLLVGSVAAFDPSNSPASTRFDPEGIRAAGCEGNIFVSDEYGPFVYEFGADGKRRRVITVPNKFLIDLPSPTVSTTPELLQNAFGRQANRGMEGLAISPDNQKLFGIMQSPLIQDGGLGGGSGTSRVGTNVRILETDLETGAFRELLYVLDSASNGISEILAVNDHELLVLERDGRVGAAALFKKVFLIDIADATDIRSLKTLPSTDLPADVTPVVKTLFLDLLDPAFGLAGATFPEKIEGLAFGPDLHDGRHLLIVSHDNDFVASQSSKFYAFAVSAAALPGFEPQSIRLGRCTPGH